MLNRFSAYLLWGLLLLVSNISLAQEEWTTAEVGSSVGASASFDPVLGKYTFTAGGAGITGVSDNFGFIYRVITGDGELTARIPAFATGSQLSTAGVMLRDSLNPMSSHVAIVLTRSGQVEVRTRSEIAGKTSSSIASAPSAKWVRIRRAGTTISTFYSADGVSWTTLNPSSTVTLGSQIFGGLVLSNQGSGNAVAEFDNIVVPWQDQDIGTVNVAGSASYSSSTKQYTIKGAGVDPSVKVDAFNYFSRSLPSDCEIVTRIESMTNTGANAKSGIMVRAGLTNNAPCAFLYASPAGGGFKTRTSSGGNAATTTFTSSLPIWLKLVRKGTTFDGYRSTDGTTWTLVSSKVITMTGTVGGLAVTSQSASTLCTGVFSNLTFLEPWTNEDVGTTGLKGSCVYTPEIGRYALTGSGAGIAGTADAFHYLRRPLTGDGQIVARISSQSGQPSGLRSGVVIRNDLTAGSPEASVLVSPSNGVAFNFRTAASGAVTTVSAPAVQAPVWIRLMRVGNAFSGYWSSDGVTWNLVATQTVALNSAAICGLAVSSQSTTSSAVGTFDEVTVGGADSDGDNLPDSWETQKFGNLAQNWQGDADGDGYSNGAEYEGNTNPTDSFNGAAPILEIASGDGQYSDPGTYLPQPLVAGLRRGLQPIAGATVTFLSPTSGGLAAFPGGGSATSLNVVTDANGLAPAYFRNPSGSGVTTNILFQSNVTGYSLSFYAHTTSQVSLPALSPDGGTFATGRTVTATCSPANSTIHYTLDGSTPTQSSPFILSGQSLNIADSVTLKLVGYNADPHYRPSAVKSATYAITGAVSAGYLHSLAIQTDGTPFAWGGNNLGQLGTGDEQTRLLPTQIAGLNPIATCQGVYHTLALTAAGEVWAWGANGQGQLGVGNFQDHYTAPVKIPGLSGVVAIASGAWHSLALKADGTVWTWGYNVDGQLGTGNTTTRNTPGQLTSLTGVKGISAGDGHSVVVKSDGTVWSWGRNASGQLGNARTRPSSSPVQSAPLTGAATVSARGDYSLALTTAGEVWAWGDNVWGQLGNGNQVNQTKPVRTSSMTGVSSISAGLHYALALKTNRTVWGWGRNDSGQLGVGNVVSVYSLPLQVTALSTSCVQVAGGYAYSLFVKTDGSVAFAGLNDYGQFGNGTSGPTIYSAPVTIPNFSLFPKAAAPVFNPSSGAFPGTSVQVTVTSITAGAEIHYTLNGQDPQLSDPIVPANSIVNVPLPTTLKAKAWKSGRAPSAITSATYTRTAVDTDGDGISDDDEIAIGTNPTRRDSDGDGADDNVEIANGTDPRVNNGFNDPDHDGLTSAEEAILGTNPNVNDLPNGSTGLIQLHTPLE